MQEMMWAMGNICSLKSRSGRAAAGWIGGAIGCRIGVEIVGRVVSNGRGSTMVAGAGGGARGRTGG